MYKSIYGKNTQKWCELYSLLKSNNIDKIINILENDVETILHDSGQENKINTCIETIDIVKQNINAIKEMVKNKELTKNELCACTKREFDEVKFYIFNTILNTSNSEIWMRYYGKTSSIYDNNLCGVVDSDLYNYNLYSEKSNIAERIVIGHCIQHCYTTTCSCNTSYNSVIPHKNKLTERLVPPSKTSEPYYNDKHDNLIFGITMDCYNESNKTHKLYRVDVGSSRGFDIFTNYKEFMISLAYIDFFEKEFNNDDFGLILDYDYINDQFFDNGDSYKQNNSKKLEEYKIEFIKKFFQIMMSRTPQVLEINKNSITIVRATIRNIYKNQKRNVVDTILQTPFISNVVNEGGL
jgi:hypothetical protein